MAGHCDCFRFAASVPPPAPDFSGVTSDLDTAVDLSSECLPSSVPVYVIVGAAVLCRRFSEPLVLHAVVGSWARSYPFNEDQLLLS